MMHDLEMPLALSRFQIDATETFAEQIIAGTMSAVEIGGWRLDGKIDKPEFFIDRDLGPHAGVSVGRPRIVLPGVVAEFTGLGNRIERPKKFAGLHVECANLTFRV